MSERSILAETATPDGILVMMFEDTWHGHIVDPREGHGELAAHLDAVLAAVSAPDHREPDPFAGRERFYKRAVGPSRWLMVVVSFEQEPARIETALGYGHGRAPAGWNP
ncbi:MAG TPA: hypothetical protein VGL78_12510 [Solirubrobacteraceae bacterium]